MTTNGAILPSEQPDRTDRRHQHLLQRAHLALAREPHRRDDRGHDEQEHRRDARDHVRRRLELGVVEEPRSDLELRGRATPRAARLARHPLADLAEVARHCPGGDGGRGSGSLPSSSTWTSAGRPAARSAARPSGRITAAAASPWSTARSPPPSPAAPPARTRVPSARSRRACSRETSVRSRSSTTVRHAIHVEVHREAEHHRLDHGRDDQHEHHAAVAERLADLLAEDRCELDARRGTPRRGPHASLRWNRAVERATTATANATPRGGRARARRGRCPSAAPRGARAPCSGRGSRGRAAGAAAACSRSGRSSRRGAARGAAPRARRSASRRAGSSSSPRRAAPARACRRGRRSPAGRQQERAPPHRHVERRRAERDDQQELQEPEHEVRSELAEDDLQPPDRRGEELLHRPALPLARDGERGEQHRGDGEEVRGEARAP